MKLLKIATILFTSSLLIACSSNPIKEIACRNVDRKKLELSSPYPLDLDNIQWKVINESNYEEIIKKSKDDAGFVFLVALDEKGYKKMALNNAKILRYLKEQKFILAAYRKYYE